MCSLTILAGGMKGADIGLGWIDAEGKLHFEVWKQIIFILFLKS